jgi:hypothetical protein
LTIGNAYTIQDMVNRIKQFSSVEDSRLDKIEKMYQEKKIIPISEITYLKQQINSLTSGKEKYKNKIKSESKEIISDVVDLKSKIVNDTLHKKCIKCGVNLLKKQIIKHGNTQRHGSTFMLSKSKRNFLKKNIRGNLERFLKRDLSDKVCDSCYHEIIFDTRIYDVKCIKLSKDIQDIDGHIFLQNFDETKIIFVDKRGRFFKIIPTTMIKNYQIVFHEEISNYRKIKDDLSFILFNRSEKEKQERKLSSSLNSIDTKLFESLSIEFKDESIMNEMMIKSKNINELYADIESICKNDN